MNKTFKYALSTVLAAAMVTPAFAQGFPDVQDTHWAYEAVTRLKKEGIITGYPDGTFQGKKNITRYEMATLLYAIYQNMKNVTDGLNSQIEALEAKVNGMKGNGGGNNGGDTSGLRDALKALQSDVSSMKAWGSDVAQLKKMASSYEKELSSLGVDVEAMKKDIKDLDARIKALESKKSAVTISGDVNFFTTLGVKGDKGASFLNQDARGHQGFTNGAGFDTLQVAHELGLTLKTDTAKATIVFGNMVGGTVADQSNVASTAFGTYASGAGNIYLHELYADLTDSLVGLNFDARIGRQGIKINPYVLQRLDNTSFFANERYDNGEYAIDGITAGLKFGGNTKLGLFLGTVGNSGVQPITVGAEDGGAQVVSRTQGAVLKFGLGDNGGITGSFVQFDANGLATDAYGTAYNRHQVYGIDLDYKISDSLSLAAGTGKSTTLKGSSDVSTAGNADRTTAALSYKSGDLGVGVGYRKIGTNYVAPGDWGRFGIFRNVNNVKGVDFNASYKLSDNLSLMGSVANLTEESGAAGDIKSNTFGAKFKINSAWTLNASYEDTKFSGSFGTPEFKYTTLGFGYDMGANTTFNLAYQFGDVKNLVFPVGYAPVGGMVNGGTIAMQFSVRF